MVLTESSTQLLESQFIGKAWKIEYVLVNIAITHEGSNGLLKFCDFIKTSHANWCCHLEYIDQKIISDHNKSNPIHTLVPTKKQWLRLIKNFSSGPEQMLYMYLHEY